MKIFFDFDGTLVDIAPRHYRVYKSILESMDKAPLDQKAYWEFKRSKTSWQDTLAKSGSVDLDEFLAKFIANIEKLDELEQDQLFSGVRKVLEELSFDGHELYLVSLRRNPDNFYFQLDHLGIRDLFTEAISGHSDKSGEHTKVDLIKNLTSYDGAIMVGDTEVDVNTAKELGIKSVAVTSGIRNKKVLEEQRPSFILESVNKLKSVI